MSGCRKLIFYTTIVFIYIYTLVSSMEKQNIKTIENITTKILRSLPVRKKTKGDTKQNVTNK